MNYKQAITFLDQGRDKNNRPLGNNTRLIRHDEYIAVKLHDTEVVKIFPEYYQLFSGGWHTLTTKDRINNNIPATIIQHNSVWYVSANGYSYNNIKDLPIFFEGIKIDLDGKVISATVDADIELKQITKIKLDIKKYTNGYIEKLKAKKIDMPGAGDCWFCNRIDAFKRDNTHLKDHIEENYYVPSLLVNALRECGYQDRQIPIVAGFDFDKHTMGNYLFVEDLCKRAITKYLQKRLIKF